MGLARAFVQFDALDSHTFGPVMASSSWSDVVLSGAQSISSQFTSAATVDHGQQARVVITGAGETASANVGVVAVIMDVQAALGVEAHRSGCVTVH